MNKHSTEKTLPGTRFERMMASLGILAIAAVALSGLVAIAAEAGLQAVPGAPHAECLFFAPQGQAFRDALKQAHAASDLTARIAPQIARAFVGDQRQVVPGGSRTGNMQDAASDNVIDQQIFGTLAQAGVSPAGPATDLEFIRRVTLDLAGRIPKPDRVLTFVADTSPDKRTALVDELLAAPEYVDKWTMYFGDLFKNVSVNSQVTTFPEGAAGFREYIRASLAANKPYNQMAAEIISATGTNSYTQGELNWLVGGFVNGSPSGNQDIFDQQAANVAETFLGISHMNCVLCHNGRGHLDALSVWGKQETRYQGWQLSAFFGKTGLRRVPTATAVNGFPYYWSVVNLAANTPDYPLNTTTGNRPARAPVGTVKNVAPVYPFTGDQPANGETYRAALARLLTNDQQFSRAIVNYLWAEFFGRGIVEPTNQFDLLRLTPDTLPAPDPSAPRLSTVQPSHPALLEALATGFRQNGFNVKALIRSFVTSKAYQLSSQYNGAWSAEYEPLFARKYIRRLWGEEILDSIIQSSNVPQPMSTTATDTVNWAMQLPEPRNMPRQANISAFLDTFYRGNRDNEDRRGDASIGQSLVLMNDALVYTRARASGTGAASSLARTLLTNYPQNAQNKDLVQAMFVTVLSRGASATELTTAVAQLGTLTGTPRQQAVEDLLWSLYNKVDFLYNY